MHKPRAMVTALVLYSPYLTHRDPGLWTDPLSFRPERFAGGTAAWSFIPFAAGERTCLGRSFAQLVLGTVLGSLAGYFGGWVDVVVMRLVDIVVAFPFYVLVIALVFVLGPGEEAAIDQA